MRSATFARAIRGSNAIAGCPVTMEDALGAVEDLEPVEATAESWQAVIGYRNAMTYVSQLAGDPHFAYGEGLLRALHFMMTGHDSASNPGLWRPGHAYVRSGASGEVLYEGPDAELLPGLMGELTASLAAAEGMPGMVTAALAHLNLVMIHPFSDGNGRMARGMQTLVLAREGVLAPVLYSIEEYLGRNAEAYFTVLADTGKGAWNPERSPRPWVRFCLTAHFRQASTLLRRGRQMARIWEELGLESARHDFPERAALALLIGAYGNRIHNAWYRKAAQISQNLASRELKTLADLGLIVPHGEGRGRYYLASEALQQIRARTDEPQVEEDPFARVQTTIPGIGTG